MEIVNNLKSLLNIDLKDFQTEIQYINTLNAINKQSETLNTLVETQLDSCKKFDHQVSDFVEDVSISPQIDNQIVTSEYNDLPTKSFDELLNRKLKITDEQAQLTDKSIEKKPYLKKGEGLKRFNRIKTDITSNPILKNCRLDRNENKPVDVQKPTISKKVISLSKTLPKKSSLTKKKTSIIKKVESLLD